MEEIIIIVNPPAEQDVIVQVDYIPYNLKGAVISANSAATNANNQATIAQTAATNADIATAIANNATSNANLAANAANLAKGWTPVYANVADGQRIVQKLVDYIGGTGTKPTANINSYVTATGFTTTISLGVDIRGASGSPTAFELRGSGSPLGVVAANVGVYYTDVNATNGAIRWIKKTGTGNSGWVVEYGDTGILNYAANSAWLNAFVKAGEIALNASLNLKVRRYNDIVFFSISLDKLVTPGVGPAGPIPIGFQPAIPQAIWGSASNQQQLRIYFGGGGATASIVGPIVSAVTISGSYPTTDAWPTSL